METNAVHIVVRGRVQGVWYRASAQAKARELKLTGWVKNNPDGAVEIHAEGSRQALNRFTDWCREGPPAARVDTLDTAETAPEGMDSFEIR